jgi:hypothetical protein
MIEAGVVVRSALLVLDEALPVRSRALDEGLVSNLAESVTRFLPVSLDEFVSAAFIEGLSNTRLKELLREPWSAQVNTCEPIC